MTILGYPIQELFLYFLFYSFLGWLMETCYCSLCQRRLVDRGFLYGPVCPIYGSGVILMILFFTPLKSCLPLFYVVAVVVMTSWEYFVAWLLETTTHMKYWDYSKYRFNIKGRVCLWVALVWGALSYLVIFWIHPPVEELYQRIPLVAQYALSAVLLAVLLVDTAFTIRHLALISKLVVAADALSGELQVQLSLGRAELSDKLEDRAETLRHRYSAQVAQLEKYSRRFRSRYANLSISHPYHRVRMEDIHAAAKLAREELQRRRAEQKARRTGK